MRTPESYDWVEYIAPPFYNEMLLINVVVSIFREVAKELIAAPIYAKLLRKADYDI